MLLDLNNRKSLQYQHFSNFNPVVACHGWYHDSWYSLCSFILIEETCTRSDTHLILNKLDKIVLFTSK